MKFLVSEARFDGQQYQKLLISREEPERTGHWYLWHKICQIKPSALPSSLNDNAYMLTAIEVTDHVAAETLTSSDEQYAQDASTPPISLKIVGWMEHRQCSYLASSIAV